MQNRLIKRAEGNRWWYYGVLMGF